MSFVLRDVSVRHASAHADAGHALHDVALSITQGEQVVLIGPSGAGKTTLLHTLACAQPTTSGELSVFDTQPWALPHKARHALRARLFLAPQTPPLPPRQRVVTTVLAGRLPQWGFWKSLASLIKPHDTEAAYDALARFDLQDKLYARVDRLSGGERQRCGLARALVSTADALLMDEPISALDPSLSRHTLHTLKSEAKMRKATLVCSLHQVDLALAHFPRIIGLRDGRIAFDAPRNEVSDAMIAALYSHAKHDVMEAARAPVAEAAEAAEAHFA